MWFVETSAFTEEIDRFLNSEEFRLLQASILRNPHVGKIIPGSGGLRKLRWARPGIGKRAGLRIIYHFAPAEERIYLLYAYAKSEAQDLSQHQTKLLAKLLREELS